MTHLLDSNVLIALAVSDHVHHDAAVEWWSGADNRFATCPITQGALLRLLIRQGCSSGEAAQALALLTDHQRHTFWPDSFGYDSIDLSAIRGHGQVTDTYLAALARHNQARLATFDEGLVEQAPDVATLIPVLQEGRS